MDEREERIAAIVASGRASRPRSSRAVWIAGLGMGVLCIAAFVVVMLVDSGDSSSAPIQLREGSRGFATGVAVGVVAGIAIGYAIARRRRDQ